MTEQKKRILFVNDEMRMGGVARVLNTLMASLPADRYEIDLLILHKRGMNGSIVLEQDFKQQLYTLGYAGELLCCAPWIAVALYGVYEILRNFRKLISLEVLCLAFSFAAALGASWLSGHTLDQFMKNDQYTIGNNPTDVEQKYFQELTDAVNSGDEAKTADAVVKCFISDYFTWTNKDGNYEVGGLQYVYQQKRGVLETQSRWTFYGDLDLYISQYGRANLLQVKDITTGGATKTDDFVVKAVTPEETLPCYYVEAHWTYENSSKIDVDSFQKQGAFYVGKTSSGRMEIVAFYDTIGGSDSTATESTSAAQEG